MQINHHYQLASSLSTGDYYRRIANSGRGHKYINSWLRMMTGSRLNLRGTSTGDYHPRMVNSGRGHYTSIYMLIPGPGSLITNSNVSVNHNGYDLKQMQHISQKVDN